MEYLTPKIPIMYLKLHSLATKITSIIILTLFFSSCSDTGPETNRKTSFNDQWKFLLGDPGNAMQPGYDDSDWRELSLPHDWAIEGEYSVSFSSGTGYLPGGIGWYRKAFMVPGNTDDKTMYLMFDGAYQNSEVWINGEYLGKRPYGYISFYYDITPHIRPGKENVVAVRLDHTNIADSRWYTGNGIYRNVWLITTGKVHVKPWGTYVTTPEVSMGKAVANVGVELVNSDGEDHSVRVLNEVYGPEGERAGSTEILSDIGAGEEAALSGEVTIPDPALWSPESPSMYKVVTTISVNGEQTDRYTTGFGIRTMAFDPDSGFTCNGKSYKLKGICLHHDFGPLGAARHPNSAYMVLKKLKAAGANAIRTAHNPEDPYLLTMLDTMGFFVQGEAFDEWRYGKKKWMQGWNVGQDEGSKGLDIYYGTGGYSDFFDDWAEQDLKAMVRRDRNHPSIVMWSIGNEIDYPNDPYADRSRSSWEPGKPEPTELVDIAGMLTGWVKELDTTRFVTAALANIPLANRLGYAEELDIVGYNYQEQHYQEDHAAFPERIIYGSENGDSRRAWEAVRDNDFVSAQFLWTGIDYHGEAGRFPRHSAGAGIMDMCGFEKPMYYERKSWWTTEPMVKAVVYDIEHRQGRRFPRPVMHWNFEHGQQVAIGCYTNCDEVELVLNGKSYGKKDPEVSDWQERFWPINYETGELVMTGYRDGKKVCADTLVTAGEVAALQLKSFERRIRSDGVDIAHVTVQAMDENGIFVATSDAEITFEVTGGGFMKAVGSGDLSSLEPSQGNKRKLYNGQCLAIVQSDGSAENILLTASHAGITASLEVPVAEHR